MYTLNSNKGERFCALIQINAVLEGVEEEEVQRTEESTEYREEK